MTVLENSQARSDEASDLLSILAEQRDLLRITVRGLDDERARTRTTASEFTLATLIKHVTGTERSWIEVIRAHDEEAVFDMAEAEEEWVLGEHETLAHLLGEYDRVARETEAFVRGVDLDATTPMPTAPWAPEREWWTVRRVLLHILRETAHHAGHADIIREELDGANTTQQRAR